MFCPSRELTLALGLHPFPSDVLFIHNTNKLHSEWSKMQIVDLSSLSNFQKGYSMRHERCKTWHVATGTKRSGRGLGKELIGFMCVQSRAGILTRCTCWGAVGGTSFMSQSALHKKIHRGLKHIFYFAVCSLKKMTPLSLKLAQVCGTHCPTASRCALLNESSRARPLFLRCQSHSGCLR